MKGSKGGKWEKSYSYLGKEENLNFQSSETEVSRFPDKGRLTTSKKERKDCAWRTEDCTERGRQSGFCFQILRVL